MRTRDYGTTSRHSVAMCLAVIRCAIEMGTFMHVGSYVQRAEAAPEAQVRGVWGVECGVWGVGGGEGGRRVPLSGKQLWGPSNVLFFSRG